LTCVFEVVAENPGTKVPESGGKLINSLGTYPHRIVDGLKSWFVVDLGSLVVPITGAKVMG
jgi:hypothetical protein